MSKYIFLIELCDMWSFETFERIKNAKLVKPLFGKLGTDLTLAFPNVPSWDNSDGTKWGVIGLHKAGCVPPLFNNFTDRTYCSMVVSHLSIMKLGFDPGSWCQHAELDYTKMEDLGSLFPLYLLGITQKKTSKHSDNNLLVTFLSHGVLKQRWQAEDSCKLS